MTAKKKPTKTTTKKRNLKLSAFTSVPRVSQGQSNKFMAALEELELFYAIVNEIGDEVLVIRNDGRIAYANQAAVRGMGYPKEKILNKRVTVFFHERKGSVSWLKNNFAALKKKKKSVSFTIDRIVKGGITQTIETTAVYMKYAAQEYVLTVSRDISKKSEVDNLKKEAEKMQAIQHFIAGTTHEIQYPLQGVWKLSENLIEKYRDRDFEYIGYAEFKDMMKTLEVMNDQLKYCLDTTERLLSINRQKVGIKSDHCDVNDVIKESVKLANHQLDILAIKVKLKLGARLADIAVGQLDMLQIITCILTNAIQSITGEGIITIKTSHLKNEDYIRIDCIDNGIGIPKEALPRIYEPFFTTKERGLEKSSGLGLAIVYSIIRANHGEIRVKSSSRKGTAVSISFPLYKSKK